MLTNENNNGHAELHRFASSRKSPELESLLSMKAVVIIL